MKIALCFLFIFQLAFPLLAADAPMGTAAPAATDATKAMVEIERALVGMAHGGNADDTAWDSVDSGIGNYQKQFGVTPRTTADLVSMRRLQLSVAKRISAARYNALVQELAGDPHPEVAAMVARVAAWLGKPVEVKFNAVDGSAVDSSEWRGKVVLIDFWATWSPESRAEETIVAAAYQKYHAQGFEVVGIALDKNKDAALAFIQARGMAWPQDCEGKVWDNAVSHGFGITSVPTLWLVDKQGMLATTDGTADLAGQVEKLLAAP